MASSKRANLVTSRVHWSNVDLPESLTAQDQETQGSSSQDSVREWLSSAVTQEDAKHVSASEAAELLRRNPSSDDDLVLGVEASLYGKQGVKTVQDFLRRSRSSPVLSRLNSFSSAVTGQSGSLSVMDILNLWNDDPEEVLLDLGFGCDEPDISGRIPARFINHQSQARGINLQVFLEAQKNRLDLENPDVSNRFRQLEVLHQVTTAFSSLVGASSSSSVGKDLSAEAQERRRRVGMLFQRASKKSLSQIHNRNSQEPPGSTPETPQSPPVPGDNKTPVKRVKPGLQDAVCLSSLAEERGPGSVPLVASFIAQTRAVRPWRRKEGLPLTLSAVLQRKKSLGQSTESFDMEEIHSIDENSVTGSVTGGAEITGGGVQRTSSCQSDSSGFVEEPFVPSIPSQPSAGSNPSKAPSGESSETPASSSPPHTSSSLPPSSPLTSSGPDKAVLSSPCPPPQPSLVSSTPSLVSKYLPHSNLQSSETETPPDPDLCRSPSHLPASFSASAWDPLPPSPPSDLQQPASLTAGTETMQTEDKEDPFEFHPPPTSSPSPDSQCPPSSVSLHMSSTKSDSPLGILAKIQSKRSEVSSPTSSPFTISHELEVKDSFLSPSPSLSMSPISPHCTSSFASNSTYLPQTDSTLCSPEDTEKESLSPDSDSGGVSNHHSETQAEDEVSPVFTSLSPSSHLCENPSRPASVFSESSKFAEDSPKMSCLSSNPPGPVSALPSVSPARVLTDTVVGGIPDVADDSADTPGSPVLDIIRVKTDRLILGSGDNLQTDREGEAAGERHADTLQTVSISDTNCSAGLSVVSRLVSEKAEIDPQLSSSNTQADLETKRGEFRIMDDRESESNKSFVVLRDESPEGQRRTDLEPKVSGLIQIESLDVVFETSVDGSEGEGECGDVDAICKELDSDGLVYWAEPIQVSVPTESGSFESSEECPVNPPADPTIADLSSSKGEALPSSSSATVNTDQTPSKNAALPVIQPASSSSSSSTSGTAKTTKELKPSGRSVSVQMLSSPSSHIIHRKDVPYMTDSKRSLLPVLGLDTSSPFRAVQSWTDLHIQRNAVFKETSGGQATVSMSAAEAKHRPAVIFSSSPSFPLLNKDWRSHDCLPGLAGKVRTGSASVDTGLWPDEDEDVDRDGEGDEEKLLDCCCSCDHHCSCCNKQHKLRNLPYSLDELEELMLCLQRFRSVLNNMEEQLSEDQASVYSALSDQDREKVRDIEELRRAVKQEAGELEMQLSELAHHYDDSFRMKMQRLLDEQSLLCSQLRLHPHNASSPSPAPSRTVATQCCLLPWLSSSDMQNGPLPFNMDSSRHTLPESESEGLGCSPTKVDKLDVVDFLQRLKQSLLHSVNADTLE